MRLLRGGGGRKVVRKETIKESTISREEDREREKRTWWVPQPNET